MRLVDRFPRLTADELAARFRPPQRFAAVRFETYLPNPAHPSQAAARAELERFAAEIGGQASPGGRRFGWWRRPEVDPRSAGTPGRYLDGGFGVGKTHLLASLWHTAPEPKAYLTFAELTSVIGFEGMEAAVDAFAGYRLLCIDEFELDDVANTLMTVTFLRSVMGAGSGLKVAATSNTLPDRLGEGRFQAEDFQREIAAIASYFDVLRVDGPDYRASQRTSTDALDAAACDGLLTAHPGRATEDSFDQLLAHLRRVHPVHVSAMLDDLDAVVLRGLHPIANQGDALLFVHLVDELYDAEVRFGATGCRVDELFPETYRHGGYRKKYGRAESRLAALLGAFPST